jgi:hypothetical protein
MGNIETNVATLVLQIDTTRILHTVHKTWEYIELKFGREANIFYRIKSTRKCVLERCGGDLVDECANIGHKTQNEDKQWQEY